MCLFPETTQISLYYGQRVTRIISETQPTQKNSMDLRGLINDLNGLTYTLSLSFMAIGAFEIYLGLKDYPGGPLTIIP